MSIGKTVSRLIAMTTLLVAVACSDGITRNSEIIPDHRMPIAWSYYSDDNPSRGMHTITYDILKDCHFGVFATATGHNDFDDNSIAGNYLYNHEFGDGADDIWRGIPTAYWPLGSLSKLSFFLYAPYDATLNQIKLDSYERGALRFDYSPSVDNIAGQFDLCVADAALTLNRTYSTSPIDVSFVHCLTKVMLYARYAGASTSGYQVRIDEVAIKGIIGKKTLTYDLSPDDSVVFTWSEDADATEADFTKYCLLRNDTYHHLGNIDLLPVETDGSYLQLQLINGYLYLLPQKTTNATMDITFSFNEGDKMVAQFMRTITLPAEPEWKAGQTINYKITIDIASNNRIEIVGEDGGSIDVEPWNPSENDDTDINIE